MDDVSVSEIEVVKNSGQIIKSKRKKSRKLNPLTKSVRVVKKCKAKVLPAHLNCGDTFPAILKQAGILPNIIVKQLWFLARASALHYS